MIIKQNIVLPAGRTRYVHVNRNTINSNTKNGKSDPVITVKDGSKNYYGKDVTIKGSVQLTQNFDQLSCGARVYIITDGEIDIKI